MKRSALLPLVALLAAATPAVAQTPKISGLVQIWYTQMLSDNLRLDSAGTRYYDGAKNFTENTFLVRRSEIHISGDIANVKGLSYEINIDPSINTSASNPTILQDAYINWAGESGFEVRAGQMKTYQTYEGVNSSSTLIFAERSQLGRVFGDKRDRGVAFGYKFGDADFGGKATVGFFNGMTSATSGKSNDTNAQKDFVARLEFNSGKTQKFGVYGLTGATDVADKSSVSAVGALPGSWTAAGVTAQDVYDNRDKTTSYGAFYIYDNGTWHFDGEAITGLLGRRFSAFATYNRENLDQKFMGFYATAAYTTGAHTFALRYDRMNYNQGDKWYGANPYIVVSPTTGTSDFSPKFTEITAGYTYALNPALVKAANVKLNYIHRSKNFLAPSAALNQTGEQGGDSLVAAFQIAF